MSDSVHKPHDKLFKAVFSDPAEAGSFFQAYLPGALTDRIDWNSLKPEENSFVDEKFAESESDLLFQAKLKDTDGEIFIYVLFEHQSKPDRWMRFRLLKYMCRIWDESFREFPGQKGLVPILPVLFYQGESSWNYSEKFSDLFVHKFSDMSFAPEFKHFLIDQSGYMNDDIRGSLKARIAQMLMKAAFHRNFHELSETLADLLSKIPETGGISYVRIFITYLIITQERAIVSEFAEIMNRYSEKIGGNMLSAAQEWLNEGFERGIEKGIEKGKIQKQIEIIENMLKAGIDWNIIRQATGLDPDGFEKLKIEKI